MIKLTDILSEILSEKKLCPKGRAYYNRRISAGEKPSAYLSGRAVKVCKGLMKEDDYFTGSKFEDDEGNKFSVEQIYNFVKKDKTKYYKSNFPLDKIKHNIEWWNKNYDIKNPKHKERMMNADTSFPLLVIIEKNGNYSVADGLNRLYKAIKIENKKTLPIYLINKSEIEQFSNKLMKEDEYNFRGIDPSEAYNDTDAVNTLVKRKRDLAFIVKDSNTDENWANIQKIIKDNDIRIMYVKGNPHHAYVAYLPGSENKATKLKDLAEKYDGYLSAQATKEDTIQIGRLLGYKEDKIKEYVNKNYPNDPIKEGKYDDKGEGAGYDLVKQNPFNIKKLVDRGIIFITKPGDGKGGLAEPNWEGDLSIITYYNIKNKVDPWMIDALNNLLLQSIPYVQKSQDKLIYNGKYNQILWGIEQKGFKPEYFYLNINESLDDWFEEKWVRIDTQGNITGPCGTMKKGKATTRCLPRAKANSLTKDERAATARKKVAGSKKGKQFVSNTDKAKVKLRK